MIADMSPYLGGRNQYVIFLVQPTNALCLDSVTTTVGEVLLSIYSRFVFSLNILIYLPSHEQREGSEGLDHAAFHCLSDQSEL